jgi:hypothetical protein
MLTDERFGNIDEGWQQQRDGSALLVAKPGP